MSDEKYKWFIAYMIVIVLAFTLFAISFSHDMTTIRLHESRECVFEQNYLNGSVAVYSMNPEDVYKNNATSLTIIPVR